MFQSTRKNLSIKALLLLAIVCTLQACKQYAFPGEITEKGAIPLSVPYFDSLKYEYHYSANIVAYNNKINGVLVVKKIADQHKRVVLLSDFGNTLFDFEYKNGKTKAIYVMDNLNKKIIVNKLGLYFALITQSQYTATAKYENAGNAYYLANLKKKKVAIHREGNKTKELTLFSNWKTKAEVAFHGDEYYADSIFFTSKELPMEMVFRKREKGE